MHESSRMLMGEFVRKYLIPERPTTILDVGSMDVCGSYRTLFSRPGWSYTGVDLTPGPNVDVVARGLYNLQAGKFDVVISGQCAEHVQDLRAWMEDVASEVLPGGLVCIIAPWRWDEHRFPVDCWRILPDGMRWLLEHVGGFEVLECFKQGDDCVGIGRKKT